MKKFVFSVASRATGRLQIKPSGSGDENVVEALGPLVPLCIRHIENLNLRARGSSRWLFRISGYVSCSLSRCSSVKLRLLSLFLPCSLSRSSSEQFRLLSLALCAPSPVELGLLAAYFLVSSASLSLYSKLEDIINKISRIAELRGAQPIRKIFFFWVDFAELFSCLCLTNRGRPFVFAPKTTHSQTTWNFALVSLWCGRTVGRSVGRSRDYQILWDG